jgi:hypothetical protein
MKRILVADLDFAANSDRQNSPITKMIIEAIENLSTEVDIFANHHGLDLSLCKDPEIVSVQESPGVSRAHTHVYLEIESDQEHWLRLIFGGKVSVAKNIRNLGVFADGPDSGAAGYPHVFDFG